MQPGFWIPPPMQKMVFWGRQLNITGGQTRESEFSHYNLNQRSWPPHKLDQLGSKNSSLSKLHTQRDGKHHEVTPPFSASGTSHEMYNILHLHMRALHTAAQTPMSRTQPMQIPDAFSKLLTFWTLHNTVWILIFPLGWEVNGQEWVIIAWIIHSTHKQPPVISQQQLTHRWGRDPHKLNYAHGDNPCAATEFPEEKYREWQQKGCRENSSS